MNRKNIYYWKSDRPFALKYLQSNRDEEYSVEVASQLREILNSFWKTKYFELYPANGQGNHLTYITSCSNKSYFVRLENGIEEDNYMLVESEIIRRVKIEKIPVPDIVQVDVSRSSAPFSYQIMELINYPDLNKYNKCGNLESNKITTELGRYIATWQNVPTTGFGPFDPKILLNLGELRGFHISYYQYFTLNLKQHLQFLYDHHFFTELQIKLIYETIEMSRKYLEIESGCLVHKDVALWNLLGTKNKIEAIIDWDDAISGDPIDDLSLFACFHNEEIISSLIVGYSSIKKLPSEFLPRFYLHLLRNMIVKAVLRVGGRYFDKDDDFFLVDSNHKGLSMSNFTKSRIFLACDMLNKKSNVLKL